MEIYKLKRNTTIFKFSMTAHNYAVYNLAQQNNNQDTVYICEDIDAVVLHLGTNDNSGSVNKVKEDINRLADKMKGFQNTHFYVAELG